MTAAAPQPRKLVRWAYTVIARDRVSTKRMLVWSMTWTSATVRRVARQAYALGAIEVWAVVGRWTEEDGWNYGRAALPRTNAPARMSRERRAHLRLV